MNRRALTLSLAIAFISMFMVYSYISSEKGKLIARFGVEEQVVIAKEDIKEFDLIDDNKVDLITIPKNFVQPGAIKDKNEIRDTVATVPILKGEQITKPRITYPSIKTGLSRQINPNKRAIAINISDSQAVSKLLKPGDRVDILAPIDFGGGRRDLTKVKTILQDVLVLSTGMTISKNLPLIGYKQDRVVTAMNLNVNEAYSTITLEVDPFEAQKLIFLTRALGVSPYLTLRNNNDKNVIRIKSTDLFDVLGDDDREEAKNFFNSKNTRARPPGNPNTK